MTRKTLLLSILCLLLASPAAAFDGFRRGFVFCAGIGPGLTSFTQEYSSGGFVQESDRSNEYGFSSEFSIGYGLSETLILYYSNRVSWFSATDVYGEDATIASGVLGIGINAYQSANVPTTYYTGAIGISSWDTPFGAGSRAAKGLGVRVGFGYEFRPHWAVELGATFGNPSIDLGRSLGDELTTKAFGVHIVLIGTAY